jgi:PAS domain S-box-containing protein
LRSRATSTTAPTLFLFPFTLAVLVSAWYGGLRCGLFATMLSTVAAAYLGPGPDSDWRVAFGPLFRLGVLAVGGVFISLFCESLHRYRRQAEAEALNALQRQNELGREVSGRRAAEQQLRDMNATLERRVAERTAALATNEALLRQFIKYSPAAIAMFDRDMRYLQCSDRWLADYHLTGRDIIGLRHYEVFPDVPEKWKAVHRRVLAGAVEWCDEDSFDRADGSTMWLQWECRPWRDAAGEVGGLIMSAQIITERKMAEEQVKASLREKKVLLKEIHHRVKNNLQIISALLDLQSEHTHDGQALEMFKESQGRVRSMALIHERLYHSQYLARVNFAEYVRQLADDLYRTYKVSSDEVVLGLDIDVPPLPIDVAIPCGLLLNELISNCLKHAFKGAAEGNIRVMLRGRGDDATLLAVADDGAGFPPGLDFRNTTSFGMQLVNTLVEQLTGDVEVNTSREGTDITVTFRDRR